MTNIYKMSRKGEDDNLYAARVSRKPSFGFSDLHTLRRPLTDLQRSVKSTST